MDDKQKYSIDHIKDTPYNPRVMDDPDEKNLRMSITTYGDLSGIVWNRRTGTTVGGHQRMKQFRKTPNPKIEYLFKSDSPNSVGTVARGLIWLNGFDEPFSYREVDWPVELQDRAIIAANRIQGRFHQTKLRDLVKTIDPDLRHTTGMLEDEVDALLAEEMQTDNDNEDRPPSSGGDKLTVDVTPEQREAIDAAIYKMKTAQPQDSGSALYNICMSYLNGNAI